jgi:hypothetical protein
MKKIHLLILPIILSSCSAGGHIGVGEAGVGGNLNMSNNVNDKASICKNNSSQIVQKVDAAQK